MKKETNEKIKNAKENLKNAFDDIDDYKEYKKSDIAKNSRIYLIFGLIIVILGIIGYIIVLCSNISEDIITIIGLIFPISMLGAYLLGIYFGQARYHYFTKENKSNGK